MKIVEKIKGMFQKSLGLNQATSNFWNFITTWNYSTSGVVVTADSAMNLAAVFACVKVLAETVGSLPLMLYARRKDGKERLADHPLYRLLHDSPNPEMTSMQWRETVMAHLLLHGNHFSEIVFDPANAGKVKEIWPLPPGKMSIVRRDGALLYKLEGYEKLLPKEKVLHIRGLSLDGITGLSPIAYARETIGIGLAGQEYASRFFSNDATPGGVVSHPGQLGDVAYKHLETSIAEKTQALSKKHRFLILEEGMKWERISMSPEDAQLLQSRKFSVEEIARVFRVPLHKIQSMDRATFSNIEQQAIEFATDSIRPWLVRIEQEIFMKLISEAEKDTVFAEFLVDGLLRGDIKSRYEAYAVGRNGGWLSANDIRRLENMNDIVNGNQYLVPLNMTPAGQPGQGENNGRA